MSAQLNPSIHPQPDPLVLLRYYRQYLMGRKLKWMGHGSGHRCLRGLIKYRAYIHEYLAAKYLVFKSKEETK